MKKSICLLVLLSTFIFNATAVEINHAGITEEDQGFHQNEQIQLMDSDIANYQTEVVLSDANPRLLEKRTLLSHYEIKTQLNNGYYQRFGEYFTGDKIKTGTLVFNVNLSCSNPNKTKVKTGFGYFDSWNAEFKYDSYDRMEMGTITYMNCGKRPNYNTYEGCVTNDTGGALTGRIWIYSVDGYM